MLVFSARAPAGLARSLVSSVLARRHAPATPGGTEESTGAAQGAAPVRAKVREVRPHGERLDILRGDLLEGLVPENRREEHGEAAEVLAVRCPGMAQDATLVREVAVELHPEEENSLAALGALERYRLRDARGSAARGNVARRFDTLRIVNGDP